MTVPDDVPAAAPSAPVVPGAVHRVLIDRRDDRGRGIAALGRRELRVRNALPGETVDVRLEHVGKAIAVGRLTGVVTPAAERFADACPHGAFCPGCGMRTLAPAARRAWKRERIVEALSAAGFSSPSGSGEGAGSGEGSGSGEGPGSDPVVDPCVASPLEDGFRAKAYLVPRRTRKGILLGIYEEGTHDLVEIEGCPAHAPAVERALYGVRVALARIGADVYDERRGTGRLRGISVRASIATGEALVVLVVTSRLHGPDRVLADEIRRRAEHVVGVVANVHPEKGNHPFGESFEPIVGRDAIEEASGDVLLRVSAGSFFQVNPAVAGLVVARLREEAKGAPAGPAVDLFGGVGASAISLARDGRAVVLVESSAAAARDAQANAVRLAPADTVEVVTSRVEEALPRLAGDVAVVVANPPRSGLSAEARAAISGSRAQRLLYVSCDPRSLARDVAEFRAGGLELRRVVPFDMIPQTPHVEALAVLSRAT